MSTFTLVIFSLTTSNLPWFMDLTFQVPMQYCSLQHWTLLLTPIAFTTGYCFCFGSILSFFLGTYWPGGFLFQYPIILPFHTIRGVLKARILKGVAIPFSSGPHFFRTLHHDPCILGHHQMVNTESRLIMLFAAKGGEVLYSQQKQDWELSVAQIMNSLLPNSDLSWRK